MCEDRPDRVCGLHEQPETDLLACRRCVQLNLEEAKQELHEREAQVEALRGMLRKYGRHIRGCRIKPDSPVMRALQPKGEPFVPVPCDCGFTEALAATEEP